MFDPTETLLRMLRELAKRIGVERAVRELAESRIATRNPLALVEAVERFTR